MGSPHGWLLLVATAAAVALCLAPGALASCSFNHKNLMTRQPLLLQPGGSRDVRGFVRVDSTGVITLQTGDQVELACPGLNNYLKGSNILPVPSVTVACVSGYTFTENGVAIALNQVECALEPLHEVRQSDTQAGCQLGLTHQEVGFRLETAFLPLYDVCLNKDNLAPAVSRHWVVSGGRSTRTTTTLSPYLFTGVDPSKAYEKTAQTQSFTVQLGQTTANKYITTSDYLESNLLTPVDDFVYGPQRMAVYFYLNSVPLWRQFGSGFWRSLEGSIRELARTEGDLHVFTSASGVARLPNDQGQRVPMYLHADASGTRLMPLPETLIKIVTNDQGQEVIFVSIAPSAPSVREALIQAEEVCEDVCGLLSWLPWRGVPASERPVACCRAADVRLLRHFPHLQTLDRPRAASASAAASVDSLLTGSRELSL